MNTIIKQLPKLSKYIEYIDSIKANQFPISLNGLTDSQKAHFIYSTKFYLEKPICIIASNDISAKSIIKDIKSLTNEKVYYLSKKEFVIYDYDVQSLENTENRAYVLSKLVQGDIKILVTTIEAMIQPVIDKQLFVNNIINIKNSDTLDISEFTNHLINSGYERNDMVESKGQFCIRGGIIDVFPNNMELGVRIELFGDEVDSIRTFNVVSQRSIDVIDNVQIYPTKEYIFDNLDINKVISNINKIDKNKLGKKEQEKLDQDIEEIENGNYINKIDKYFSAFYNKAYSILEYIPNDMLIFFDEIERIEQRINNINYETNEIVVDLLENKRIIPNYLEKLFNIEDINELLQNKPLIYLQRLEKNLIDINMPAKRKEYNFNCREVNFFRNSMDIFIKEVQTTYQKGNTVIILMQNKVKAQNLSNTLNDLEITNKYYENIDFIDELEENKIYITIGYSTNGYEYRDLKLVVISDNETDDVHKKKAYKSSNFKNAKKIVLADLSQNDYIVHMSHGIGQFIGIETLNVNDIKKDYVKLKYKDNDTLYVPTNQLDSIRKYIPLNDGPIILNKLGTKQWAKAKAKAKESADNIAKELILLYAQRQNAKGFSFLPDNDWQKQFEDDFPYQETDDQIRCIKEIKQDMEKDIPMDRLLCGDVGYGKTEVAIRAAFKAVMSGKQVAYLVPTTILANQQYESFKQRMKQYEIRVEVLNRFKTKKEQSEIIKKLKLGEVDIVVGTHRILQKDIGFKNLGLLIIDEEHRFGVKHKETIKELRKNIDVLSMTATPIPRTLHMSIVGIRDMSVIYDPPHNRKPVQTYVLEYDKFVIQDAMVRELERDGQVFYLYNKVEDIEKKTVEIQNLVPNAVVEFAHGQMSGDEIESIMYDFIEGKIDVLVCTTILESGIDIPNANTIIIENADRMGLAQLYQIRGRVGRKDKQAYAYITYRKNKLLSEIAEKRLKAIKEFTEFGSGFKIALRDLEIRGAGNIIGSQQHGHMEAIGYEMYCKLLEDAVRKLKGEEIYDNEMEVQIDLQVSAYIPDSYINNQNQKIEVYQNIALCEDTEQLDDIIDEVIDRYGEVPKEVINLIGVAKIKIKARQMGICNIVQKGNNINFEILDNNSISSDAILNLIDKYKTEIVVREKLIIKRLKKNEINDILNVVNNFLNDLC